MPTPLLPAHRESGPPLMTASLNELPGPPEPRFEPDSKPVTREVGLAQLRDFVVRHRWPLLGLPVLAIATTLLATRLIPARYKATATLLVSQLELESDIEGQPLPIHGLQWLLESPPVVRATEERVAFARDGEAIDLTVGKNIESEMRLRRREESALAPMIELTTRAESAELAVLIANSWSEAFTEHLDRMREVELGSVLEVMKGALVEAETDLRAVELSRDERRKKYEQDTVRLATTGRAETSKVLARHDGLLAGLRSESKKRFEDALVPLREYREGLSPATQRGLERVVSVRRKLADTPQRLVLVSTVVPDRIAVIQDPRRLGETEQESVFAFSEELNPRFLELSAELDEAEKALHRIASEDETMRLLLVDVATAQESSVEQLSRHEYARFSDLQLEEKRRRVAEEALQREFELDDEQLRREFDQALHYRDSVATRYRDALLSVRAQGDTPIQVAAEAVASTTPTSRNLPGRAAIAALLGLMLAIGLGVIRDLG